MPSSAERIVNERVRIDPESVRSFFAGRATRATCAHPLTSVLYQDQHPELAEERDRFERQFALPKLCLESTSSVLDVGCGIGRWAQSVLPVTGDYTGIDLTEELIVAARERYAGTSARFFTLPATQLHLDLLEHGLFDRVLIAGLLIYLNDDAVEQVLRAVAEVCGPQARIYLREPLALTHRLTLREFWSQELGQHYNAVYRTRAELEELLARTLYETGFVHVESGDLYPDPTLNNRAETRQQYLVMERM